VTFVPENESSMAFSFPGTKVLESESSCYPLVKSHIGDVDIDTLCLHPLTTTTCGIVLHLCKKSGATFTSSVVLQFIITVARTVWKLCTRRLWFSYTERLASVIWHHSSWF